MLRGRHEAGVDLVSPSDLRALYDDSDDDRRFRSHIEMARYRFGEGEYKYFATPLPGAIQTLRMAFYPQLAALNIMNMATPGGIREFTTPESWILSAIIFNALIIVALIPLALKGVAYRPIGAGPLLRRNLLIYGLGGIIVPFIGIKLIDVVLVLTNLA